jgi:uncharacterized membrane protein YcgQ (UPF0703/DUF1980 family)
MDEKQSAGKSLIIAAVIFAITAVFFTINYVRTKKGIEDFNTVLGKDEKADFSLVVQTILNDNKYGTTEEYIRYTVQSSPGSVIEIREKMFIAHVRDVYLNTKNYLGKTIKLEGIFWSQRYLGEEPYYSVVRYGPGDGCCGPGEFGFEVKWPIDNTKSYPADNAWVEATGVLKSEQGKYYQSLYLELSSLTVLSRRGSEQVRQ